jgi:uncharacterized membrane protein
MNTPLPLLPSDWQMLLWGLWAATLLPLLRRAAWQPLREAWRLNLWCAAIAVLFTLWSMRYGMKPGIALHLLGATILTLMFGPGLARLALYVVAGGVALAGFSGFESYPLTALVASSVPVQVAWLVYRLVERRLPPNIFVFIFVAGFLGAALAMAASACATAALLAVTGTYELRYLADYYLPYALLLSWGEAFITGMTMALMIAYYPKWVMLFDDKRYLARR